MAIIIAVGIVIAAIITYFGAIQPTLIAVHSTQTAEALLGTVMTTATATTQTTAKTQTTMNTQTTAADTPPSAETETPEPVDNPLPTVWLNGCIDSNVWTPTVYYSTDNLTQDTRGCWNLSNWGIYTEADNGVRFEVYDDDVDINRIRAISTPIDEEVEITFKTSLDHISSSARYYATMFVGVGNAEGIDGKKGRFWSYSWRLSDDRLYSRIGPFYNDLSLGIFDYAYGTTQNIRMVIDKDFYIHIWVDGKLRHESYIPRHARQVLWIGYSLPGTDGTLSGAVTDIRIRVLE